MKSWRLAELNGTFQLQEVPLPSPGPGELLVRVMACGLNFADLLMREGKYQEKPPLPYTPGMEVAGVVTALGPGVAGPLPGTRVLAFLNHGGLADEALAPAERVVPIPDAMPFDQAAAFPIAYGTSHLALAHKARLQPDETLLVLGAAGGVGLTAVEIGKRMGARVVASARGAEKLEIARAAGADAVIDSDTPDLKSAFKALGGVDVVYDAVGGAGFDAALSACRPEGRLLAIGFASGQVPQVPANLLLVKNLSVMGLYWGGYLKFAPQLLTGSLATLLGWYAEGGLRPHISHRLPFAQLPQALELLRDRKSTGKVVVRVQD
ncbi:NADPH:quinone oxidoreductase family protein [Tabrizicola oligotrophica]|uniref:NADPH:quinone oxidoreductase family protein n=1 Tax=Tabrizicola oligotrophica TaxID=2710650 RepID=A0A6M0QTZ6_9RHOB|nr:NADPH:quinone oxidoreductase family protein [Tabrizicola oligotrophica]NEY90919.1 NADPH:quinone oxidoreductase family protein [Tabrizicola oligotrophica]